ncbi:hypothetical protein M231_06886 [Tremella mesenterica]|uniref:Uncharacterized protein n=1 Tax=Tremella mesenterica TaxID=5217 RepID=A0A4Q1BAM8_TREME|nr:hypothetical protein M231_06886 [Tremella mesenterica]
MDGLGALKDINPQQVQMMIRIMEILGGASSGAAASSTATSAAPQQVQNSSLTTSSSFGPVSTNTAAPKPPVYTPQGLQSLMSVNNNSTFDTLATAKHSVPRNSITGWPSGLKGKGGKDPSPRRPTLSSTTQRTSRVPKEATEVDKGARISLPLDEGLIFVPSRDVLAQDAPWTEEKYTLLHDLCEDMDFIGFPSFQAKFNGYDVREEVIKAFKHVDEVEDGGFSWVRYSRLNETMKPHAFSMDMAAGNLITFFKNQSRAVIVANSPFPRLVGPFENAWEKLKKEHGLETKGKTREIITIWSPGFDDVDDKIPGQEDSTAAKEKIFRHGSRSSSRLKSISLVNPKELARNATPGPSKLISSLKSPQDVSPKTTMSPRARKRKTGPIELNPTKVQQSGKNPS